MKTFTTLFTLALALQWASVRAQEPLGTMTVTTTIAEQPFDLPATEYREVPAGKPITITFHLTGSISRWVDCWLVSDLEAVKVLEVPQDATRLSTTSHWYDIPDRASTATFVVELVEHQASDRVWFARCYAEDTLGRAVYNSTGFNLTPPRPYKVWLPLNAK